MCELRYWRCVACKNGVVVVNCSFVAARVLSLSWTWIEVSEPEPLREDDWLALAFMALDDVRNELRVHDCADDELCVELELAVRDESLCESLSLDELK